MERVNLIKGDKEATDIIVNGLLKYAIDFYGKEYEDIIIQAIREISFYELSKHESFDSVIEILTGFPKKKNAHKYNTGCFLYPKNPKSNSSYNDIIIYRQTTGLGAYLTIAHELFGHGVCSRINRIVEKDSKIYNRNGIALHSQTGEIIELPKGATPIDFAYAVHTDLGNTMIESIVNDQEVPFEYELKNDDRVIISADENSNGPTDEWLDKVVTAKAKRRIEERLGRTR